jgi:hypothetical protein
MKNGARVRMHGIAACIILEKVLWNAGARLLFYAEVAFGMEL